MDRKKFANILFVAVAAAVVGGLAGAGTYFVLTKQSAQPNPEPAPPTNPDETQITLREGQREGPFLLEKIYPDHVTGLNFREYPLAVGTGQPVTLRVGDSTSNGCTVTLKLVSIEKTTATFYEKTDLSRPCPICLAKNTLIDTPGGAIQVQKLQKGMAVWSLDKSGKRIPTVIVETGETPSPPGHSVVHLVLNDGREAFISPGHPTIDGRTVGELAPGDLYDNAYVISAELVPYVGDATYDILPSGDTGFYWANGIPAGSTLH